MLRLEIMSRDRARISILSELLAFPTINGKYWDSDCFSSGAILGDLVSLSAAPASKWYLSWVKEIDKTQDRYLLESIEDGSLCWWSNVGLNVYNRDRVKERLSWMWNDKQYELNDRWLKVCSRNASYIVLPVTALFNKDGSVVLDVRIRFVESSYKNPTKFENYKKLTMKKMEQFYLACTEEYNKK